MLPPFISFILTIIVALVAMAFYTLFEQKVLAYSQSRKGPNKVSISGIPQPMADAVKLFSKEAATPTMSNPAPFMFAPVVSLVLALLLWSISPSFGATYYITLGIILFLTISSLSVYTTMAAGWASNSKYALLGALRGVAQTISYEVSMSLLLISALLLTMSFSFTKTITLISTPLALVTMPIFITWFMSTMAETNRAPFDFAEGESELVSGFNTEYSSGKFAMIFMAEYASILVMCFFTASIFMQTASAGFMMDSALMTLKTGFLAFIFLATRAAYPRLRYDLLMYLTWKSLLPLSLVALTIISPLINLSSN